MGYVQEMRRKVGKAPLLLVGAGVFVIQNGKVLLQRRRDNGLWSDQGGCIELGESTEQAARRELLEESGLVAETLTLLGVFAGDETQHYVYPNGDECYFVAVSYLCEHFRGELLPQEGEVRELRWFPIDNLPPDEEISPPVRPLVRGVVEKMRREGRLS